MGKFKRSLAVMLMSAMLVSGVAACGGSTEKTGDTQTSVSAVSSVSAESSTGAAATDVSEKMDITVALWGIDEALANADNDQFLQAMYKKLNITLKPRQITWDDYTQKAQIWSASGDMPDIMSIDAVGTTYYRNWINQGVIKPLPEDLSKYPTLKEYMNKPDIQALKQQDGKIYTVPRSLYDSLDYCAHDRVVLYRWDLAQKAGIIKEPQTWDEFNAMLKAIVEKDPEGKKISGLTANNIKQISGFFWLYSNPAATSDGSGSDYKWIKKDGKYVPAVLTTDLALPSLQNMRTMYEQRMIDRDIANMKGTQSYDKFVSGTSAALLLVGYGNVNSQVNERWKKLHPDVPLFDAVKKADYFPSTDGNRYHCTFKTYWSESYFSNKMDDKKMDRIMMLYDYMLQPETKEFYRYGVKDVDYKKDGDKITKITNQADLDKKQPSSANFQCLVEFDNAYQYDPNNSTMDPAVHEAAIKDLEHARQVTKQPDYEVKLTDISTPTKDKFSVLDYEFMLKIMAGKDPVEKMWADVLKEYEAKGLSKMIEEVNAKAKEMGLN